MPIEDLRFCTSPIAFFGLDKKKRRAKLLSLAEGFGDSQVIKLNPKFKVLENELSVGTVDELISRSKKSIKVNKDNLDKIPARIDECEKQKVIADIELLNQEKIKVEESINQLLASNESLEKQYQEYNNLSSEIMELKFKQNELQRKANEKNQNKRVDLNGRMRFVSGEIKNLQQRIDSLKKVIQSTEFDINDEREKHNSYREKWKIASERQFDDSGLVCPYCKQEYPNDKKQQIYADFEKNKKQEIDKIIFKGNSARDAIDKYISYIEELKLDLIEKEKELDNLKCDLNKLTDEFNNLPSMVDISDSSEYIKLQNQIHDKEQILSERDKGINEKEHLTIEIKRLNEKLQVINTDLSDADNSKIDLRISELKKEQIDLSQKIADEEKMLNLLEEFNRTKISMLTDKVNVHFDLIQFQMFKPLIKGGYEEVCEPLVNGTSYDSNLNYGHKILADIDICKTFQKINNIQAPIFLDNSESLDEWRIPKINSQLIVIRRTDLQELKIEEVR